MATHQKLKAWQLCHELALAIYAATNEWPNQELFGLTSQARRAAYSAAANIAEGWARGGRRELARFLRMSLSSLAELSYTLLLARDSGMLPAERWAALEDIRGKAGAVTWKLFNRVRKPQAS